jgi:small GTP-binding protein
MDEKEKLANWAKHLPPEAREKLKIEMNKFLTYEPKVAIFGKTGVGKASLTNALFGKDVCKVSDLEACTREPQEVFLKLEGASNGIKLLDVPGIGESAERDKQYFKLYAEILKEADMALWVLKADDRTFSADEEFYRTCMKPYIDAGKPFAVAVSQVDKIEPFREWDEIKHLPGPTQEGNIAKKLNYVAQQFGDLKVSQVVAVSANENYNLSNLMLQLIKALPADKRYQTIRNMDEKLQQHEKVKKEKNSAFIDTVFKIIEVLPILDSVKRNGKELLSKAREFISDAEEWVSEAWQWFKDLVKKF